MRLLALILAVALSAACSVEPQPIHLGAEECSHCRMVISDRQFASQAVTTRGKAFSFDAIECLAEWVNAGEAVTPSELHGLWVADFSEPERWVAVEEAVFLRSDAVRSPMGVGLTAHSSAALAREYQAELGGETLTWSEVLVAVARHGGPGHQHHVRH